ncbi:hypothetical protein F4819DRAFT_475156 [Hypoxylon fuscum]|nr:hypothetical protein F4819DRAFT_475156 [Hypoxylon fuscum]
MSPMARPKWMKYLPTSMVIITATRFREGWSNLRCGAALVLRCCRRWPQLSLSYSKKTQAPFVTKISDAFCASPSFHNGHIVLVGDAFTTSVSCWTVHRTSRSPQSRSGESRSRRKSTGHMVP